ncbi:MAG: glycosyltransferase [Gemmatimonadaceae bacterium]|nr:glycosyltransferase [Gemmatimonadaceae bacterium]
MAVSGGIRAGGRLQSRRVVEIVEEYGKSHPLVAIRQPQNCGKRALLRRGFERASGEIIAVQDADFEYAPEDLVDWSTRSCSIAPTSFTAVAIARTVPMHRTFHYA